jgi:hypothetical protein
MNMNHEKEEGGEGRQRSVDAEYKVPLGQQ